jgi:PIN domain nuclease of toxin-antitoxin system
MILLDTCAAIWIIEGEWIRQQAAEAIDDAYRRGEKVMVSPITGWEVGMLAERGRLHSRYAPEHWLSLLLARPEVAVAELPVHVLLRSSALPGKLHRDPADRIIAATAQAFGYTVMTRDRPLLNYGREGHLSVLEC